MILVLIRHGVAIDRMVYKKRNKDDRLRPLTSKGRKKMIKVSQAIKKFIRKPDMIVTSPLLRAMQTAEILAQTFRCQKLVECVELSPECSPESFVKWLKAYGNNKNVICIVGHEPHLGFLSSWLLNGSRDSFIEFKKSGVLGIELDSVLHSSYGKILFLCQPKQLLMNE